MTDRKQLASMGTGDTKTIVVKEEVHFATNVLRGFAFTLGTILAFVVLGFLLGRR